jgi:hypothetical protein
MRLVRSSVAAGVAGLTCAICSPLAAAATRYAAPNGGKEEPCAVAAPCELAYAVENAKEGDEVVVLAERGPYAISAPSGVVGKVKLTVTGPASGPLPEIDDEVAGSALLALGASSTARRLHLVGTMAGGTIASAFFATFEDDVIEARAPEERLAALSTEGVVRDSVLFSGAEEKVIGADALSNFGVAYLRNDTIELPGVGSTAVRAAGTCVLEFVPEPHCGFFSYAPAVNVANTILRGGGQDVVATASESYAGRAELAHSNARNGKVSATRPEEVVELGGNQSGEPLLTSDFHELAGSPTIDAGLSDPLIGAEDLDGNPRTLGAAPDIGAYEFVPPAAAPAPTPSGGSGPSGPGGVPPAATAAAGAARVAGTSVKQPLACTGVPGLHCRFTVVLTTLEHLVGPHVVALSSARRHTRRVTVGSLSVTLASGASATVTVKLGALGRRLLAARGRLPLTATVSAAGAPGPLAAVRSTRLTLRGRRRR